MLLRSFFSFLVIFILISPVMVVPVVQADDTVDVLQASADILAAKMQALDKEIAEYNVKINNTQGQAKTLKQALANLELRKASLAKEIQRTQLSIKRAQEQIVVTEDKLAITEEVVSRNQSALSALMRTYMQKQDSYSLLTGVLSPHGHLSDIFDSVKRGDDISKAIGTRVRELQQTKKILATTKSAYESSKQKLESLQDALTDQKHLVEQTSKDKNALLLQTKNKESEYQRLLADRRQKKSQLEQEMLDVESRLKVAVDSSRLPKYGTGVLKYPVDNVNITQYFGNTPFASKNPQVYNGAGHNGIDFGVKVGTSIYAAEGGTVLGVGNTDVSCSGVSYGKWVLIKHNNGLSTLYAHLSVINVKAGDVVTARQKIALSGNTGYSTGPHLHFTVYASDAVHISGPTEYKSKVCGTYMIMPLAPRAAYLNPLSYL